MTFTKEQLDDMVHDAQRLSDEYSTGFYADEQVQDVALHVKALAAEVERLQRIATSETERCMDLEAIVDRLPKTADGVPVTPGAAEAAEAARKANP